MKEKTNTRMILRVGGILLVIIGVIIMIYSFVTLFGNFGPSFVEVKQKSITWLGLSALGGILLVTGGIMFYFSILRPISKYVANEVSPAITTASEAFRKGIEKAVKEKIIKVKCPYCGYLESEDAEFCSKCGKRLRPLQ